MKEGIGEDTQTKKPQKTGIPRLLEFTGRHRPLLGACAVVVRHQRLVPSGTVCVVFILRPVCF